MKEKFRKLTMQELIDRLTELSASLSAGRGYDKTHASCKSEIEDIQEEIRLRQEDHPVSRGR
jgi:hypothetical protein